MTRQRLDEIRASVLTRMERAERNFRLGIAGAALTELVLLATALLIADLRNPIERLVFVMSILGYTIIVLGLVVLGAHVSRTSARVLLALSPPTDGIE